MKRLFFFLLITFCFISCEKNLIHEEFDHSPEGVYNVFWCEFDRYYGAFLAKEINWDSVRLANLSNINNNTSDRDLFTALSQLLNVLNDGHASVSSPEFGCFRSSSKRDKSYFSDINSQEAQKANEIYSLISTKYLKNNYIKDISSGLFFFYGTMLYNQKTIGFIFIPSFNIDNFPESFVRQAADSLKKTDGIVIDLRFNSGGRTDYFVSTLNCFASEHKLYLKSKLRNGPKHSDFTGFYEHYTYPVKSGFGGKPIAILANSVTASSSEHFILGMKSQPNVILVGDTTCGAFSEVHDRLLPNGWMFRLGPQVIFTPEGNLYTTSDGKYIEGIGITPDFLIGQRYNDILIGRDVVLDKAVSEVSELIVR